MKYDCYSLTLIIIRIENFHSISIFLARIRQKSNYPSQLILKRDSFPRLKIYKYLQNQRNRIIVLSSSSIVIPCHRSCANYPNNQRNPDAPLIVARQIGNNHETIPHDCPESFFPSSSRHEKSRSR